MKEAGGNVKFALFRKKISTRYDRADPHWNLTIDLENRIMEEKDKSYDFSKYSPREIN